MTRKIAIASQNPVKINAALCGLERMFPDDKFEAEGFDIASGVADQPMTDAETLLGATQRAAKVHAACPDAEFAVGIEGGIDELQGQMFAFAWIVVRDKNRTSRARSGTFSLPPRVQQLVEQGMELGIANDVVFDAQNSKQLGGAIGSLTGGVISRQCLYEHAMALALVPWKSSVLFP